MHLIAFVVVASVRGCGCGSWRVGGVGGCGVEVSAHCWVLKEHVSVFSGVARMSATQGYLLGLVVWCVCCLRIA